jgi:hypothetical protein
VLGSNSANRTDCDCEGSISETYHSSGWYDLIDIYSIDDMCECEHEMF